jgi:hypothetical protein
MQQAKRVLDALLTGVALDKASPNQLLAALPLVHLVSWVFSSDVINPLF